MEQDWTWFTVFFGSQILGFLVVDTIAIFLVTMTMLRADPKDRKR
jgi:hypothetical protein